MFLHKKSSGFPELLKFLEVNFKLLDERVALLD
jgi:hypothetical protein